MSGHSKWSTIRHKKAIEDGKKGAAFTQVAKQIYLAVKQGGSGDPDKNPSLRMALEEAKSVNMPGENVRRAINKGLGISKDGKMAVEVVYEGYALGGVGVMVTVLTDNKNRTAGEIKLILDRFGGTLAAPGAVAYLKTIVPPITIKPDDDIRERVEEMLASFEEMDEAISVWTNLEVE